MVLVSWAPRISVSPFVLKLTSLSWTAPWTSTGPSPSHHTGGTLVHREDTCSGHQLKGGRPWVPQLWTLPHTALPQSLLLPLAGWSWASMRRRASASSSCRGCTTIPTSAAGGRRSRARSCCRSSCSRGSCVRSADARHSTRSSCAPRSGGCCGAPRPDAVPGGAAGVPGGAPGASRGSSALGPEPRGFLVKRLDFVAGQSSQFIELSPERLGRCAVQLLALVWPLMARADQGPGS
uniref:Uncharacterized protein n=1 Tax=Nomascus leucogenys TaxID=61853 RepID=A0A2I3G3G1_NOMLE